MGRCDGDDYSLREDRLILSFRRMVVFFKLVRTSYHVQEQVLL